MATYQIETNQGTFEVDADREPTPQEIEALFSQREEPKEAPPRVTNATSYLPSINGRQIDTHQPTPLRALPGSLVDSGLEAGGASLGQSAGVATGPFAPAAIPVFGAIGAMGGNALAQGRRMFNGEQQGFHVGEMLGAAPTGAIPGASLAKAPLSMVAKQGLKYAAANTLGKTIQTGIDEHRLPTAGEATTAAALGAAAAPASKFFAAKPTEPGFNSVRDSRFAAVRPEGLKAPPHALNRGSDLASSLGGKAALEADAAIANQPKVNRMAREDIGLSGEKPLTLNELEGAKRTAGAAYEDVQRIGDEAKVKLAAIEKDLGAPGGMDYSVRRAAKQGEIDKLTKLAGADANEFKRAQDNVRDLRNKLATGNGGQDEREALNAAIAKADSIRNGIAEAVTEAGKPELALKFEDARVRYAKIKDIEDAWSEATGFVDANALAKMHDAEPKLFTGNLRKLAQFAGAFRDEARDASMVTAPGVNKMSMNQSIQSFGRGTPGGIVAGIAGIAGKPVRKALLSDLMQDYMARPKVPQADLRATLLAQVLAEAGRR